MSARVLNGWIEEAEARSAHLLVLEIDTPGGLLDSMREMTGALLDSSVPVAVIVTPAVVPGQRLPAPLSSLQAISPR